MHWDLPITFQPAAFVVKAAVQPWEVRQAMALRRAVFCVEQGLFAGDDRDAIDDCATLLVAVAQVAGMPDRVVGTVRIHQRTPGTWYGSRLAVEAGLRRHAHLGTDLIALAVRSAHSVGAQVFLAHVQQQNVALFEKLHWQSLEAVELHGRPHQFMVADLRHYPPMARPDEGWLVLNRKVA
jgi:putative N-acetyltransferase (TIGR04045 family)